MYPAYSSFHYSDLPSETFVPLLPEDHPGLLRVFDRDHDLPVENLNQ